ncbi:SUF system Fe-S cluster assembly regulator [Facilibium subflavum]|uniref:SUF system Fe-S cluster assembly regulator n=1 Tax=Facilibium subflavum TaxID=2219058 RepID=UPI0013C2B0C7|nr:SUF system Fe-S cluster assembly regulator [Facilibium subflavum]
MLRVSKLADYAVMIVVKMANDPQRLFSATELVAMTRLNLPTVRKLLKLLSIKAVLKAKRGAEGGYVLARQAENISMVDIIEAIDGPIAFTECCVDDENRCRMIHCQMHSHWLLINHKVRAALGDFSLKALADTQRNQEINHNG